MKKIQAIYSPPKGHWVGDGFPVRSLLSYDRIGPSHVSPFLLLDYAAPYNFSATGHTRGVGQHPHRGFETVTIVYAGELEHRDSTGSGGLIGPGDVQWMTAGAGIVHEEFHSKAFAQSGGSFEVAQLWVNLAAKDKSEPAAYQTLLNADIPKVDLANDAGQLRVIAGEFNGYTGPAKTYTPMNVWDVELQAGHEASFTVPVGHNSVLVMRQGKVLVNNTEVLKDADLAIFSQDGEGITIVASDSSKLLLLTGEPIDEPVVGMGPFVMNTRAEIEQAVNDYQRGRFGSLNH